LSILVHRQVKLKQLETSSLKYRDNIEILKVISRLVPYTDHYYISLNGTRNFFNFNAQHISAFYYFT